MNWTRSITRVGSDPPKEAGREQLTAGKPLGAVDHPRWVRWGGIPEIIAIAFGNPDKGFGLIDNLSSCVEVGRVEFGEEFIAKVWMVPILRFWNCGSGTARSLTLFARRINSSQRSTT